MAKYRKKPVVVDAWQLTEEVALEILEKRRVLPKELQVAAAYWHPDRSRVSTCKLACRSLEGEVFAEIGDWIITGVAGEMYPCEPGIFHDTYEAVES